MISEVPLTKLNIPSYQRRLLSFLLVYRWVSLAPALWLFLSLGGPARPSTAALVLLTITTGFTLLITLFHYFNRSVLRNPLFLGADLLFIAVLLTFSGAGYSPYAFYALNPLLFGAFFFEWGGLLWTSAIFTIFYLSVLGLTGRTTPSTTQIGALFTQLAGLWLIPLLFEFPLSLLKQLAQTHQTLVFTHDNLAEQNAELNASHQQLEGIHELTLALQSSDDSQSIEQRLLKAVTGDLGFSRAIIGIVNPTLQRLEGWQMYPPPLNPALTATPLFLLPENGLIVNAALDQQVRWCCTETETLVPDEAMSNWLGKGDWVILPMVWQEQTVGVLLVAVKTVGPVNLSDDRWAVLTSLISQASLALGIIDRTRHLATEKERNRIARDIHDTVAQSLFGIAFTLDACIKLLPGQAEMVKQELLDLRHIADRVRQEVRQSILDIWPSVLTEEKFKADLAKYATHTAPDHAFHIDFTIEGDFDGLAPIIRRSFYRASQEALANTARHAGVYSARLYLYVEPHEAYLSVRDKGCGFDSKLVLSRERSRERFGLKGMQERIHALNGTCDILSQVGYGTQVLIRVPIQQGNGYG